MSYTHFTLETRTILSALLKAGLSQEKIAKQLGIHRATIWREINKNSQEKGKYHARLAHLKAKKRRKKANAKGDKIMNNECLKQYIIEKLRLYWSPEQIAGRLRRDHNQTIICHETIYRYIYEKVPGLRRYLRQRKGKYRRRHGTKLRTDRAKEQMKKRINTRPEIVEKRERVGDWEGDTIVGKERKLAILTHVDRKTGYLIANKLNKITAEYVNKITMKTFKNIPDRAKNTITYDNGTYFSQYEFIERATSMDIYFAFPYHSWERGTNENTNGLLRQFYPKKSPFRYITQSDLDKYVNLINNRPRKRLHYRTPFEVFNQCCTSS